MSEELAKGLRLGSPSNPVVLALIEFEGHRLLDIRKHFIEKSSNNLKPTRKGVSLNANLAKQVQNAINSNEDSIFSWLEGGDHSAFTEVERAMAARTKAVEEEAAKPRTFAVEEREWKGAEFFTCESHGAGDVVYINSKHPFLERLKSRGAAEPCSGDLMLLLVAYYRAKLRFSGEIEAEADQFFMLLEAEWGMLLRSYCQQSKGVGHA
jgi:hypothetical protein